MRPSACASRLDDLEGAVSGVIVDDDPFPVVADGAGQRRGQTRTHRLEVGASLNAGVMIESIPITPASAHASDATTRVLLAVGHLVEERQHHRRRLRLLAARERTGGAPRARADTRPRDGRSSRRAASPRRRRASAASPRADRRRAAGPRSSASCCAPTRGSRGTASRGCRAERRVVARGQRAPARDDRRQPLQLFPADGRLDVGHPVVEADASDTPRTPPATRRGARCRARSCRAGAAGGRRASSAASAVTIMPPSPVESSLRGWNEKQATSPCGRPMRCHAPCQLDLAADRAGRVLDHRDVHGAAPAATSRARSHGMPSWCTSSSALVRGESAASTSAGVDVERLELDVHEHRHGAAVANRIGGRDEGVADGDHLVAGGRRPRRAAPGAARSCSSRPRRHAARRRRPRTRCSKAATSGPCVTQPERIARRAASASRLAEQRPRDRNHRPRAAHVLGATGPVVHDLLLEQLLRRFRTAAIPLEQQRAAHRRATSSGV